MLQEGTPRESLVKFEQPIEGLNIESKAGMMKGAKFPGTLYIYILDAHLSM